MRVKEENEKPDLKFNIQNAKIMASNLITLWQIEGKPWKQWQTLFCWAPKSLQMVTAAMKLKDAPWKEICDYPRQHIKKQRLHFVKKGPYSQTYAFSSGHAFMWEMDNKEGWVLQNWCFWILVPEETL